MIDQTHSRRSARRRPAACFDRLEPRTLLATFTVVSVGDGGPGSLRDAIARANAAPGADAIAFAIPGEGPHVIAPASPLPEVVDPLLIDGYTQPGARPNGQANGFDADLRVVLDGSGAGAATGLRLAGQGSVVRGLEIRRFQGGAIVVSGDENRIEGNVLGARTGPDEGNAFGVQVFRGDRNSIGGTTPAARNLISGNQGAGIVVSSLVSPRFFNDFASGNAILGNLIGTDASGSGPLGNGGAGVSLTSSLGFGDFGRQGNTIGGLEPGAGNVIAFNGEAGVRGGAVVLSNTIFDNGGLGIDLNEPGPNLFRALGPPAGYPLLSSAEAVEGGTRIRGVLIAQADQAARLEFFADSGDPSGFGEGRTFLGAADVTTDAVGNATFDVTVPGVLPEGAAVTATATTGQGTSEFSPTPATLATTANLVVEAAAGTTEARSGEELTYTATIRNLGPGPATDARLTVVLPTFQFGGPPATPPADLILSSSVSRGTLAIEDNRLVGTLGTLEPGAVVTATVAIRVPPPPIEGALPFGPARLQATFLVESGTFDLFAGNSVFTDVVVDRASLAYEIRPRAATVTVGEPVTIDFLVRSGGPAPARAVVFNPFFLVAGSEFISVETSRGTVRDDNSVALGDLAPGETATVSYTIRPTQPGPLFLSAMVTSPTAGFAGGIGPFPQVTVVPPGGTVPPEGAPPPVHLTFPDLPRGGTRRLALGFDTDLDPGPASDPANYHVEILLPGGRSRAVALRSASYDPATRSVTLEARRPLPLGRTIRVTAVSGGLLRSDGLPIDGDADGVPGGDFVGLIEAGHTVRYRDADGDRVTLALGGGLIALNRGPLGDPRVLRLLPVGRRPALLGRVHRAPGGDGRATLPPLEGAEGVRLRLPMTIVRPS